MKKSNERDRKQKMWKKLGRRNWMGKKGFKKIMRNDEREGCMVKEKKMLLIMAEKKESEREFG